MAHTLMNGEIVLDENKHPRPWRIAKAGENIPDTDGYIGTAEDDCIVDANGFEVIGCSEWIRGAEHFAYILECVNGSGVEPYVK